MTTITVRPTQTPAQVRTIAHPTPATRTRYPRIASVGTAQPAHSRSQQGIFEFVRDKILGSDWADSPEAVEANRRIEHVFAASRIDQRHGVVDPIDFYGGRIRSTGERMAEYEKAAFPLGLAAVESCLRGVADGDIAQAARAITDFTLVSSTGYSTPSLDMQIAHALGMRSDMRRLIIGNMGCSAGATGMRQSLDITRAHPNANVLLLCVELPTLHFNPTLDPKSLPCIALFGDASSAMLLSTDPDARGPEVIDSYQVTDFATADQMAWSITDTGFTMTLSPRVPITIQRNVLSAVEGLLAPYGLTTRDIPHWVLHPGGPSILEAAQKKLELSEEQMAPSWQILAEHGNCMSATILLILERLMRERQPQPGELGVMMAFGPGLTIEASLLRF